MTLHNAALFQIVIAQFTRGNIRDGWRRLQAALPLFAQTGCDEYSNFVSLIQAEFCLTIAGLLDRGGPRPKLGLVDTLQVLALKPFAKNRSEKFFQQSIDNVEGDGGDITARCTAGLGLLARAGGQADKANGLFAQSVALFEAEAMHKDAKRVRDNLAAAS